MAEPKWSTPAKVHGIWYASELLTPDGSRLRCRVAVSPKGELDISGDPMFPGAAVAIYACYAAARGFVFEAYREEVRQRRPQHNSAP